MDQLAFAEEEDDFSHSNAWIIEKHAGVFCQKIVSLSLLIALFYL